MNAIELRPQRGKQERFLASRADVAIYGGAVQANGAADSVAGRSVGYERASLPAARRGSEPVLARMEIPFGGTAENVRLGARVGRVRLAGRAGAPDYVRRADAVHRDAVQVSAFTLPLHVRRPWLCPRDVQPRQQTKTNAIK